MNRLIWNLLEASDVIFQVLVVNHKGVILAQESRKDLKKTLIEEIQTRLDIKFALVLLTPDNVGGIQPEKLQFCADQNVVLELGIFIGLFGRENVCCLYTEDLNLPEDYHGFEYIKIDKSTKWEKQILQELKNAGFIDKNNNRSAK